MTNIDWQSQLLPDEIGKDNSTEFVYIKGLRRLAKIKGIKKEKHIFGNTLVLTKPDSHIEYPFVQIGYEVEFEDGTVFSDVADAHTYNLDGIFKAYPTAMAAIRAEARALRKALGINLVAKEELGANEESIGHMTNQITSAQIRVIKNLMKTRNVDNQSTVITHITTRPNIVDISELTHSEALSAIAWLNKQDKVN